jgi:hypothetical protein
MNEPIPDLTRVAPHLSKELAAVVKRGLDRDRNKRFSTTQQFAEAIEAAAIGRDGIATPRDVAAFVKEMIGQEMEQQREAVRAWIARSEPSQVGALAPPPAPSSVSVAAMSLPGEGSRSMTHGALSGAMAPRRSRVGLFAVVMLLFGVAGAGGFFLAQSSTQSAPAALPVPPPAPSPTQTVAAAPTVTAEPATSAISPSALPTAETTAPRAPYRAPVRATKKKKDDALDVRNPYR